MVEDSNHHNDRSRKLNTSRRGAIGLLASAVCFSGVTTASRDHQVDMTIVNRPYSDEISQQEIEEFQKQSVINYRQEVDDEESQYFVQLESNTGRLVSYVSVVDERGTVREHFTFADDPSQVPKAHAEAHKQAEIIESELTTNETGDSSISDSEWNILHEGTRTNYNSFGDLWSSYELVQSTENRDIFAYKENFDQTGKNGYENDDAGVEMNWSNSNPDMEIHDWEPYNGTDSGGERYFEVSVPGGISYGYQSSWSEIEIDRTTNYSDQTVVFDCYYHGDGRDGSSGFQPSSIAKRTGGLSNNLFSVESDASFHYDCASCKPDFERIKTSKSFLPY
ncbi:hypothetical protein [Natrialba taiwanensis]|uniref:hypothetical protein n=1 Tax=Natrialba taiwanensis TaxID=160846 RepID=UPI001268EC5B|nr:hypothetical protein [Natrialba taiwanensis]